VLKRFSPYFFSCEPAPPFSKKNQANLIFQSPFMCTSWIGDVGIDAQKLTKQIPWIEFPDLELQFLNF